MKRIYKYPLRPFDQHLTIDVFSNTFKPLTVQLNQSPYSGVVMTIWAEVDLEPTDDARKRKIHVIGTGWDFDETVVGSYIGTVQVGEYALTPFVWHIYDGGWDEPVDAEKG